MDYVYDYNVIFDTNSGLYIALAWHDSGPAFASQPHATRGNALADLRAKAKYLGAALKQLTWEELQRKKP